MRVNNKFEESSFGTEMDANQGDLGNSMFGNSESSDTHIQHRGPSLHMAQSEEFFKMSSPGYR